MYSINKFLENITESEKRIFINSEHYNNIGRKTRVKIEEFNLFMSSLGYKNMGIAEDLGSGFFDYHYKK